MGQESRTDFLLRLTLRRILPVSFYTALIIAGTMVLSYTFDLSKPVPRKFALGMAVTISTLVVIALVVALVIRLRKEKDPILGEIQPRLSDPAVAFELVRSPGRQRQERQSYPNDLGTSEPVNTQPEVYGLELNHVKDKRSTTDQRMPRVSPHVHWLHPSFKNSQDHAHEGSSQAQVPRPPTPHPVSPVDGFYPSPLFARSSNTGSSRRSESMSFTRSSATETSRRSESIPSSLRSGLTAPKVQSQDSLTNPSDPFQVKGASRVSGVKPKWPLRHHNSDIDLELGLGTEVWAAQGGASRTQEGRSETGPGSNSNGSATTDDNCIPTIGKVQSSDNEMDKGQSQGNNSREKPDVKLLLVPIRRRSRDSLWG